MTKIDIFSGFLGAGKTTLIKKLIAEAYQGEKVVLIENEFGDISVDTSFLKDSGIEITEMSAGCICCTLVGDFEKSLRKVLDEMHPERILIEPSGVGKLSDVIKAVQQVSDNDENVRLNSFTTVVDAKKCKMHARNFGEFFINQVEYASSVVLSHTQGMSQAKLDEVIALVREHNQACTIITTDWDKLSGKQILDTMEHKNTLQAELEKLAREKADRDAKQHEEEHHHHHDDEDEEYDDFMFGENSHIFVIKDIDCPHCTAKLVKALSKIDGISEVRIDYQRERLTFDCAADKFAGIVEAIKATIEDVLPEAKLGEEIPVANAHKMLITEIDCPHCAGKLAKAIEKIAGIDNVQISHEAERLTFECAPADFDRIISDIKATIDDVLPEAKLGVEITTENAEQYKHEHCHEEHEHHHDHDEECECGHDHEHHHHDHDEHEHHHDHGHEGHHHADDIFSSWGVETASKYTEEDIKKALEALDDNEKYGMILRAKGIVEAEDGGEWIHFDYIPGEVDVRRGPADVIGRLCVIGTEINQDAIKTLFAK